MSRQNEIELLGRQILAATHGEKPGMFNVDYWHGRIMEWVMKDASFKIDMFRFVDVLPQMQSTEQISKHVREYLLREGRSLPLMIETALKAATNSLTAGLATKAIRKNVMDMAQRFIVGRDAQSAQVVLSELRRDGIAFTVDLLGESTLSDEEGEIYRDRYLDLIVNLGQESQNWKSDPIIDFDQRGAIPKANVSIKVSAMAPFLRAIDPQGAISRLKKRVLPLFLAAKEHNVFLNVDLENWEMHGITYDLFEEILSHPELRNWSHVGIVVQAYLKSASQDLERVRNLAKSRGAPITVRLVKGAYWDFEVVNARQKGFECPVLTEKAASDVQYEQLSRYLLDNIEYLNPAFGSHNLRSISQAMVYAKEKGLPSSSYEIQMLYGMAEPERKALRSLGNRVRVYAPIGELLPGMAYLVRRLLENTSNSGFLQLSHHQKVDPALLLAEPLCFFSPQKVKNDFENCPLLDFSQKNIREKYFSAVENWQKQFPISVPVVISGEKQKTTSSFGRFCPSNLKMKVVDVNLSSVDDVCRSISVSYDAFPSWRDFDVEKRASLVEKLADILEKDRFELAALQTFEVAKPWAEADADVAEAVDFCRYYAWRAKEELKSHTQGNVFGEHNEIIYEGRGPTAVIAPWNFPLAILCGMTTAALVAGNTVMMKPAEQSSAIAYELYKRMIQAGFPKDVIQFLPGRGEEIGSTLVEHPLVAQIAFTGSKEVGLSIIEKAARVHDGQPEIKRVIAEMGGKNAIVVDDDADLDEAVLGVVQSAFGFAGQKCSACSRAIVLKNVYDEFVQRLKGACEALEMGPANLASCMLGPVVDQEAFERLHGTDSSNGYFIKPTLIEVDSVNHELMQKELFGPVLAILKVNDFDEAIKAALSTPFRLTGAVFSRSPANLEKAKREFRVGNLYLNRSSTGALVHRQPFGGFGMSGIGTKAGGPGYLLNFVQARCITENTMRRGFTPELGA